MSELTRRPALLRPANARTHRRITANRRCLHSADSWNTRERRVHSPSVFGAGGRDPQIGHFNPCTSIKVSASLCEIECECPQYSREQRNTALPNIIRKSQRMTTTLTKESMRFIHIEVRFVQMPTCDSRKPPCGFGHLKTDPVVSARAALKRRGCGLR
jgi:predicted PP-loop superfamily ATPase